MDAVQYERHGHRRYLEYWYRSNLVYAGLLNVCLLNYDYFSVTLGVSLQTQGRQIEVFYELDGETDFPDAHSFQIPLAETSTIQTYFYPVSQDTGSHPGSRLTGIRLDPVGEASAQSARVEIRDFRLMRATTETINTLGRLRLRARPSLALQRRTAKKVGANGNLWLLGVRPNLH